MDETKKTTVFKYTAILEPDKEVGGYSVSIPALPGCVSQGDTFEEAVANIKEATELYLEVLKEKNEEIPLEENSVVAPVEVTI